MRVRRSVVILGWILALSGGMLMSSLADTGSTVSTMNVSAAANTTPTCDPSQLGTSAQTSSSALPAPATVTALIAAASASPTGGSAPLQVSFGGSAAGGVPPYAFYWTFGDDGAASGPNPTHTYATGGTFSAFLAVADANGNSSLATPLVIAVSGSVGVLQAGTPTNTPTSTPTNTPTNTPTSTPTSTPTNTPTNTPTSTPTNTPTNTPTSTPTNTPTNTPTSTPTGTPTSGPTGTPTSGPTGTPTSSPTGTATVGPPTSTPTATATPTPTMLVCQLITAVQAAGFGPGPTNSLVVKLQAAKDSLLRGQPNTACNQLNAFINEAQAKGATALVALASAIRSALGCA